MDGRKWSELTVFTLGEFITIALFFFLSRGPLVFYLYIGLSPLIFVLLCLYLSDVRSAIRKMLMSRDLVIFVSVFFIWLYLYSISRNGPLFVVETAYFPAFLEEFNFRFIMVVFLKRYIGEGKAVVLQSLLYSVAYSNYLVFSPTGYPGFYLELFIIDNIAMACIYGAIYYLRKNIYIDISIPLKREETRPSDKGSCEWRYRYICSSSNSRWPHIYRPLLYYL